MIEIQSQNVFSCALLLQTNAITKPVRIALVTQRKGNNTALQPQFYAFYFDQQSLLYGSQS